MSINRTVFMAATATITAVAIFQALGSSTQAVALKEGETCAGVTFTYEACAGVFAGNDKGPQGTGLSNLNSLFGAGWSFAGDNESGLVSFTTGGTTYQSGAATTRLSGAEEIAVKAGNFYALRTIDDLTYFDWSTDGLISVGNSNKPNLSHISIYTQSGRSTPPPQDIPEPCLLLPLSGLVAVAKKLQRRPNPSVERH